MPSPPSHLLNNPKIIAALHALDRYIDVDTPFNINKFELLLASHPNQPFVSSVMRSLREGFWPFDRGEWEDECSNVIKNYASEDIDLDAIRQYRDREVEAKRWSGALPEDFILLPGMKVSPLFIVWQKGKPRVIVDHSKSGINNGIDKEDGKVRYDDMRSFGQQLHYARQSNPNLELHLFKSDVAKAFLNLPVHPIWQLHQLVKVDKRYHVVRQLIFGTRTSPRCWCSVSGLMCWFGVVKLKIYDLHVYMDDYFGWDYDNNLIWFHSRHRPRQQVQLLIFWDTINCPWEDEKQEDGITLKIIGFWVDIKIGSISLTADSITEVSRSIRIFLDTPGRNPQLRDWQHLAGYLNWILNVVPWGRPALQEMYCKMSGKKHSFSRIFLNANVISDLVWLNDTVSHCIGVHFVDSIFWDDSDTDIIFWTDASSKLALSFVFSNRGFIYQLNRDQSIKIDIFFLELVAILSAINYAVHLPSPPRCILIYTDSLDSVGVFNSLATNEPLHNSVLMAAAGLVIKSGIDLRVKHIEGKSNIRTDMLSRLLLEDYKHIFPQDRVCIFSPPRELLPTRWRDSF